MPKKAGVIGLVLVVIAVGLVAFFSRGAEISGDDPAQRIESIVRLANERPRGAADVVAEAAAADPEPSVRQAAVVALGGFAREEDRPVIEAATRDADPGVRRTAVRVLAATYKDASAVEQVAEMAEQDDDAPSRDEAHAIVRLVQAMEAASVESRPALLAAAKKEFGIRSDVNCADDNEWARLLVGVKNAEGVADAFERVGEPLNQDHQLMAQIIDEHAANCHTDNPPSDDAGPGGPRP